MGNRYRYFVLTIIALIALSSGSFSNDMLLELDNGDFVLLHEDQTWDFKSPSNSPLKSDMSLILNNNEVINILTNKTWHYASNADEIKMDIPGSLGNVYSTGTAQGSDLFDTKMASREKAVEHLSRQLHTAIGDPQITIKNLMHCIEKEDKEIDIKEQSRNKQWQIQTKLSLDKYQIQVIVDCAKEANLGSK